MSYAGHVAEDVERDDLVRVFGALGSGAREQAMRSVAQLFREEARAEGLAEGRAEGRADGLRAALLTVLRARFGSLPAWAPERVATATTAELDTFVARAASEPRLEDVFRA